MSEDAYTSKVVSYTKKKEYDIKVDRNFLSPSDKVLIIDDFLATGQALKGLVSLCDQAGAEVAGIGIAIEKLSRMVESYSGTRVMMYIARP